MKDRFDLEQEIMGCWNIVSDLKVLTNSLLEGKLTIDDATNVTLGLEQLYQMRFEALFETFEDVVSLGRIDKSVIAPQCDDEDFMTELDGRGFTHEEYQAHNSKTFDKLFPDHDC